MAKAYSNGHLGKYMTANGRTDLSMEMVRGKVSTTKITLDNGKIANVKDMAYIHGIISKGIKGNLWVD